MASTEKTTTLSLKLLVDSKAQRVLYAEAGKDVVDFLFSLLTLPVGTVVKLLTADSMVGCVGNLYGSVDKLDTIYICRKDAKKSLLTPAAGRHQPGADKLLQLPAAEAGHFFSCGCGIYFNCCYNVTKSFSALAGNVL
ncbi:uncharacterized protein LOC104582979 [Brachypodium distachyon]|uniref:uncharacterized protein LOC104582979 n=1 Tax=Brachypodium distachyon TaxID=15368 RepID=UPI00052FFD2F|nr:uncharacterized protein LOC104582979 [Brachypodium distachyon]|eukprot:XP_010232911.1 uncharacterized protein LOC104582979 [Brachypodium distachyon]